MTELYFIKVGTVQNDISRKAERETHRDTDRHTKIETDMKYNDSRNKKTGNIQHD